MTDHPITPSPELVAKWAGSMCGYYEAARWGADQELEACCEWLKGTAHIGIDFELLHTRRPQPPSLREQALTALSEADQGLNESEWQQRSDTIRRALEALDD